MTERARIVAWWGYVVCVVAIFELVFQLAGFPSAVGAALLSIPILGIVLKLIVGQLARRAKRRVREEPGERAI